MRKDASVRTIGLLLAALLLACGKSDTAPSESDSSTDGPPSGGTGDGDGDSAGDGDGDGAGDGDGDSAGDGDGDGDSPGLPDNRPGSGDGDGGSAGDGDGDSAGDGDGDDGLCSPALLYPVDESVPCVDAVEEHSDPCTVQRGAPSRTSITICVLGPDDALYLMPSSPGRELVGDGWMQEESGTVAGTLEADDIERCQAVKNVIFNVRLPEVQCGS